MPRARPSFSDQTAECRQTLHSVRPAWHRRIAAELLTSSRPASDKIVALTLDEGATGAICRYDKATVAQRALLTDDQVREATKRLVKAGFVQRVQTGPRSWEWRLLRRQPSSWLPGWALDWRRSRLGQELPAAGLILWALAIEHTPSPQLQAEMPHLGPWAEVPTATLIRQLKITSNAVAELVHLTAEAGLILAVTRPRRPTIISPIVDPVTSARRCELVNCLLDAVLDRDGRPSSSMYLHGTNAPTVWEDEELAARIARKLPPTPVPQAPDEPGDQTDDTDVTHTALEGAT